VTDPLTTTSFPPANHAALGSLVLGVVSSPAPWLLAGALGTAHVGLYVFLGVVLGVAAVYLGGFGLGAARAGRGRRWMAISGIVLGALPSVVYLVVFLLYVVVWH